MKGEGKGKTEKEFDRDCQNDEESGCAKGGAVARVVKDDAVVAPPYELCSTATEFGIGKAEVDVVKEGKDVERDQKDQCWTHKAVFQNAVFHAHFSKGVEGWKPRWVVAYCSRFLRSANTCLNISEIFKPLRECNSICSFDMTIMVSSFRSG